MADERKSLPYDRAAQSSIPRWQFRLLFLLVLLNLAITIQSSYAPGVAAAVKQRWAKYQDERRVRNRYLQASAWSEPPGKVVWDDNPDTAAKLLGTPGYGWTFPEGADSFPFLAVWPRGARATVPPAVDDFHRRHFGHPFPNVRGGRVVEPTSSAPLFVHRLKTPAGEERLVYVYVQGRFQVYNLEVNGRSPTQAPLDRRWTASADKTMVLSALAYPVNGCGTQVTPSATVRTFLQVYHMTPHPFTWEPPAGDRPAKITLNPAGLFRFYAGQADPSDPSRFGVDYDLDGQRGTVHGRLREDGTVELKPTTGKTVGSRWYPDGAVPGTHAR